MDSTSQNAPSAPAPVLLRDYRPPAWRVDQVQLIFDLDVTQTRVHSRLTLSRDPRQDAPLRLDGEGLVLEFVRLDGRELEAHEYHHDAASLTVADARDGCVLEIGTCLAPAQNTALTGLYLSGSSDDGFLLTQCEAEGFRRITFFPDRPDVLARYRVTLRAPRERFPVLLSNGNPAGAGDLPDGRHWAAWEDPHPKPAYLFALVAGKLEHIEDRFVTAENREVILRIFSEAMNIGRCGYAMDALKRAMRWDEEAYGRNYDLDVFHIVATRDFNMGAMENKGLNIFNAKYLIADPERSTDQDYRHVEAIIAHEYFHNWTGNRVTCRDWFQLSLKEGLTVFREQQFCAAMGSAALQRIEEVQVLRRAQFPEDAGPLAHPVRPNQYSAIDNFYTATVYDKGAELVRMVAGRLGAEAWRRGMDEYFRRHDGAAVTVEDFLAALGEVNSTDFSAYLDWYCQAGTPQVEARGEYDAAARAYTLCLRQKTLPTLDQPGKVALPIPVRMALFDASGQAIPLRLAGENYPIGTERTLELIDYVQRFRFIDVDAEPQPSLLRGFSAPVVLDADRSPDDLAFLLRHDTDGYNRWEAAQQMARLAFSECLGQSSKTPCCDTWLDALRALFERNDVDEALLAELLTPPDGQELANLMDPFDPARVHVARERLEQALAQRLGDLLPARHAALIAAETGALDGASQGRRQLINRCLSLWARSDAQAWPIVELRAAVAPSMTERLAALGVLVDRNAAAAEGALAAFEERYRDDPVTLDKWFALQASAPKEAAVESVAALMGSVHFSLTNPNCVFALLRTFASRNLVAFHRADGAGYALLAKAIGELDGFNPQIAARVATTLKDWRRLEPQRRALLHSQIEQLAARENLSPELGDILRRALAG
jgi:aminopeptidase N